jgi:hypothetical protein
VVQAESAELLVSAAHADLPDSDVAAQLGVGGLPAKLIPEKREQRRRASSALGPRVAAPPEDPLAAACCCRRHYCTPPESSLLPLPPGLLATTG